MSCPFFFVSRRPKDGASQVQLQTDLYECLKNITDQIKKDGVYVPEVFRPLVRCVIVETVVGPSHIAFRLQDGRVCRVSYSLRAEKFVNITDKKRGRPLDSKSETPYNRDGTSGSIRVPSAPVALRTLRAPMGVLGRNSRSMNFFRDIQRQGIYLRPLSSQIPAADVPENLIEQCQMVLQGKSRQLIIRELQRTNLDVNMAVNNMLSREDEADFNGASGAVNIGDDWEDDAEDIFSLLDHPEGLLLEGEGDFQEDIIDRSSSPRFRREVLMDCDRTLGDHATYTDRRKRRRFDPPGFLRNSETYGSRTAESRLFWRSMGLADEKSLGQEEESNSEALSGSAKAVESNVQLGDRLEFWPTNSAESVGSHFISIAALYTELVAINSRGELHQWKWQNAEPFNPHSINSSPFNLMEQPETGASLVNHRHPRSTTLGINHEKVVSLSGCITRASIMTASGAIATWMDEMLPSLFHSAAPASTAAATAATVALMGLEHPATHFNELKGEVVSRILTAPLITVVQCASGAIYWWGVLPSYIRQRNAEKQKQLGTLTPNTPNVIASTTSSTSTSRHRSPSFSSEVGPKSSTIGSSASASPLSPGDLVCMRNAPMFHAGAIGFTLVNGIPKVGVLLEDAWKLTDVCRFRVKSPSALKGQVGMTMAGMGVGKSTSSTEAVHVLNCPYAQAAAAAAAAALTDHDPPPTDSGSLEMPPPPSPASSTCSDHSGPVKVSPGTFKRKKAPSTSSDGGGASGSGARRGLDQLDQQQQLLKSLSKSMSSKSQHDEEIEDWCLTDVVFVEDGRTQPVGVLLKIDGTIAAVKFLKEQDRACLAARCPAAPVCLFINQITKSATSSQKPFATPVASSAAGSLIVPHDPMAWLNDCRLLKKDDLMQVKQSVGGGLPQRVPDFVQPSPRQISMSFLSTKSNTSSTTPKRKILALAPENSRLHAIVGRVDVEAGVGGYEQQKMRHLEYHVFTLNGKTVSSRRLPALSTHTSALADAVDPIGTKSSLYSNITLTCPAERPLLLRDSAGVVFPFLPPSRPGQESWVFPPWLDLPTVQCAALAWISASPSRTPAVLAPTTTATSSSSQREAEASSTSAAPRSGIESNKKPNSASATVTSKDLQSAPRLLLGVVVVRETSLLQHILRADEAKVEETLRSLNTAPPSRVESVAREMADGHRTILHVAVLMCAPVTRETSELAERLENILKRTGNTASSSATQPPPPTSDGSGWTTISPSPPPPPPPPLPRSLHSLLNLSTSNNQRSLNVAASSPTSSVHDLFIRSPLEVAAASVVEAAAAAAVAAAASSTSSGGHFCHMPPLATTEEASRRVASHRILRAILLHPRLRVHLLSLLAYLSDDGLTPFMLAIQCKAYQVAVFLLDFLAELEDIRSDGSEEGAHQFRYARLMRYLFPPSARLDDSPLFTLCYNDTCSFTWTGPNHIRQDIFECRTCGLMDSLCCCSECARVCHKGHDCRLKRTSPTAYCDCWEKCRCRSLVLGHQPSRLFLFQRLLHYTDLVYLPNRANEHLLVYLTRCVERQTREQKQYKSARRRSGNGGGSGGGGGGGGSGGERGTLSGTRSISALDEPEHDLEPPTFSRDALELVLDSKAAAASLLCDCKNFVSTESFARFGDKKGKPGGSTVTAIQSGTSQLDDFVFTILCKCPAEFMQRLVNTLARSLSDHLASDCGVRRLLTLSLSSETSAGTKVADSYFYCQRGIARFIRSVARVYTGLSLELTPDYHKKKIRLTTQTQPLELARSVFSQLAPIALPELALLSVKVLTPVRTGALRSTAAFTLTSQQGEAIHGFDQVLSSERTLFSRSRQSQSASGSSPLVGAISGFSNPLDCPNSVIRYLLYGVDSSDGSTLTWLPTWKVIENQQPLGSPYKTVQLKQQKQNQLTDRSKSGHRSDVTAFSAEEPMEIDSASQEPAPGLSNRMKRRRHRSRSSGGAGSHRSPLSKHRRRHRHHHRRRRHRATAEPPSRPPPPPPQPQAPPPPPVIVVESSVTTTNSTASTNPFAEMELLPAPSGDSDTDADVRSNELDSNATTAAAASTHTVEEGEEDVEEEEEDFSDTASEEEEVAGDSEVETHSITSSTGGGGGEGERSLLLHQNPQIEASGSQHSSVSSTAATAGTTGSVIMDMDSSAVGGTLNTTSGVVASAASQQEFISSYPPERDQQPPPEGNNTLDEDNVVVTMFCGSEEEDEEGDENELDETLPISEMSIDEAIERLSCSRDHREDDIEEEEDDDDDDEEDDEIEDDDEVGVEEEEGDESGDDGGDSEDDEEEEEDEDDVGEEEDEDEDETEEEEEELPREHGVEDEEEEGDAYSQESEPSPPPSSPFSPWARHPGGSSNPPPGVTSTEDVVSATSTSTTTTTATSRNFPTSSSTLARLYSAALSSAFDRRAGRNASLTSRNALAGLNLLSAPLSPPRANSNNANNSSTTATTNFHNGVTPTTSSAPIVTIAEPASNNDVLETKKFGIHVTQVQLSRAFACLLRLIADVMTDLVTRGNEAVDPEAGSGEGDCPTPVGAHSDSSDLRRCVSAPVFVHPSLDLPALRRLRLLSQKTNGCCLLPLRSLIAARPANSVERALICASVGFLLAPVWAWLTETLDGLEARLRARAAWNAHHSNANSVELSTSESASLSRRKEGKSDRAGNSGRPSSQHHQQSPTENTGSNEAVSGSNTGGTGASTATGSNPTAVAATASSEVGSGRNSSNRQQLLGYLLSLMRTANNDHGIIVPPVDVSSHKHTAYLIDAFLYFFKVFEIVWPSGLMHHLITLNETDTNGNEYMEVGEEEEGAGRTSAEKTNEQSAFDGSRVVGLFQGHPLAQRSDAFFRRSASTLSLVGVGLDPIQAPATEAMPLALAPQQLQPNSRRSELFGTTGDLNSDVRQPAFPEEKAAFRDDKDGKAFHYGRIGRSFKDARMGTQIAWGGEFLDTACHTGSALSRWCRSLEAFSQAFAEDVGAEHRSYMLELARFPDKEARFRKEMERLRNATRRDLTLEVEREPNTLLISTVHQLNTEISRRLTQTSKVSQWLTMRDSPFSRYSEFFRVPDPKLIEQLSPNLAATTSSILSSRRLKVTFKDEPGEGSGVARSFITAFSEAVLSNTNLPDLSTLFTSVTGSTNTPSATDSVQPRSSSMIMGPTSRLLARLRAHYNSEIPTSVSSQKPSSTTSAATPSVATPTVSHRPRRADSQMLGPASRALFRNPVTSSISINLAPSSSSTNPVVTANPHVSVDRENGDGERIEAKKNSHLSASSSNSGAMADTKSASEPTTAATAQTNSGSVEAAERAPLFWQPGLAGFYSPRGISSTLPMDSPELICRLSLYRCVGRVIGLCLLFNETCPLRFNRHVLKYLLGRPLCWHDFAFYNTTVYEGLRQLLLYTTTERSENEPDTIRDYSLTFSLVVAPEEGGSPIGDENGSGSLSAPQQHLLVPGGDEIEVDSEKIYEFVKRYTEFKMIEVVKEPLEQMRLGVFDVLPANALDGLTAEDLRLLLNGIWDVDVDLLISYTTFLDESNCGAAAAAAAAAAADGSSGGNGQTENATEITTTLSAANERVARLKRWFWHVVRGLDSRQRQDLLYFWTSSPALPASAQGFAPMPTIMIRPADDQHLPTANTCISRLYLPLYSSKHILREKLLQAIETRSFGFV